MNQRTAVPRELTQRHPVGQHLGTAEIPGSSTLATGGRAQLERDRRHGNPCSYCHPSPVLYLWSLVALLMTLELAGCVLEAWRYCGSALC